ncbi:hypothetical protein WG66_000546 [Moniliophthora roreri]|uniref:Uncharacterized protein n=1 Tax=Moniliophthora roreri TaxID=221103 RepID=A0A0W0F5J0_MONRR|nr:hypothetical protein WG66_000546 [Moniliophthora roreri]
MPARSRVFSELLAEDESENGSPLSNFGLRPQGLPSSILHNPILGANDGIDLPRVKRRKKNGMNARFDRMVAAMNITHSPSSSSSKSRNRSRTRTGSSSASGSVLSYGPPDTPVDPYYDGLKAGALGEGFSVIKMKSNPSFLDNEGYGSAREANESDSQLPEWLSDTFSTLSKNHPLRMLIPKSYTPPQFPEEESENLFAYITDSNSPRTTQSRDRDRAVSRLVNSEKPDLSSPINFQAPYLSVNNSGEMPFSKPGPASSVVPSPIDPSSTPHMLLPSIPIAAYQTPALLHPLSHPQTSPAIFDPHHLKPNALHRDSALSLVSRSSSPTAKRMRSATQPEMASDIFVSGNRKTLPSPESDSRYTHSDRDSVSVATSHHTAGGSDFHFIPALPLPPFSQPSSPQPICPSSCFSPPPISDSLQPSSFSDVSVFSTPGPGYYTSRPSDSAPDSSSSDQVVEDNFDMNVDVDELGFQWTAFNRKEVNSEAGREPPQSKPALNKPCLRPRPDIFGAKRTYPKPKYSDSPVTDVELNVSAQEHSFAIESPSSSDVPKLDVVLCTGHHQDHDCEDDHFHDENSVGFYTALDGHHEPSDLHDIHYPDKLQEEAQQPENSNLHRSQQDDEFTPRQTDSQDLPSRLDTACPFAYSVPPLSSSADASQPQQIGMERSAEKPIQGEAKLIEVEYAHNTEFGHPSDFSIVQDPRTPTRPPTVFAPAPGIYVSPLRGSSSVDEPEQVKDRDDREGFSMIKSRLLDALDRVSGKGGSRSQYAKEAEESSESSQLSTSTDSIESWGDG